MSNVVKLVQNNDDHRPRRLKPIDKVIGESLRIERKAKGLSMEMLAGKLNITYQQLGKVEHGQNRLSVSRLIEIAQTLGFDAGMFVADLIDDLESPDRASAREEVQSLLMTNGASELLQLYGDMLHEDRSAILKLARRLAQNERSDG